MPQLLDRTDLLTVTQASKRLPGRPHRSTLHRWETQGVVTPQGRVRLKVVRFGRRTLIAPEAIEAFAEALAEAHCDEPDRHAATPSRRVDRYVNDLEAEAAAEGI